MLAIDAAEFVADADERELGDVGGATRAVALAVVILRRERLAAAARDFQIHVGPRLSCGGHRVVDDAQDLVEVHLLNVLGRIDAEAGHAEARQHDEVRRDLLADGHELGPQIGQGEQLAVLHIRRALVIGDGAWCMEIDGGIQAGVLVLRVARAVAADAGAREVGHVIDHRVRDDADTDRIAAVHHVGELDAGAGAAVRDAVAHRLIALAPVVARHDAVLLGRGDLHRLHTCGTQHGFTLGRDIDPAPFEQMYGDVAREHVAAGTVGLR